MKTHLRPVAGPGD